MIEPARFVSAAARGLLVAAFLILLAPLGRTADARDVPYVPTPPEAVKKMLEMANVQPDDLLYDLGSGDGRIVIAAIRDFGVKRAIGIDIDSQRIRESWQNAQNAGVADQADFRRGNIFEEDFSDANVITMYLLSRVNRDLRPRLLNELRPGTRLVSHQFTMGDWEPDAEATAANRSLYLWVVPAKVAGEWRVEEGADDLRLSLRQDYQMVSGDMTAFGQSAPIAAGRLNGENVVLSATAVRDGAPVEVRFEGRVTDEDTMEGQLLVGGSPTTVTISRVRQN